MTIPQLFSSVISKNLFALLTMMLLSACSGGGADSVGGSLVQGNSEDVALAWVAPVQREDGTPLSMAEIAGYRVYYGTAQGSYPNQVDIADRDTMQSTLSDLETGTYYIVVTTYDMDGRESTFSQEVTASI
jgi:hypothetical protein